MKILIVDDDEDSRILQETTLEAQGHTVETGVNGKQGLEVARRSRPDLIISDILMPEMDGFALCQAVKDDGRLKTVPFVFYSSSYTGSRDEELAMELGASRFIRKTGEIEEFLETIQEVLKEYKEGRLQIPRKSVVGKEELERMHKEALIRQLDNKVRELEKGRKALKESEKKFRTISATAQEAIIMADDGGRVLYWNEAAEGIFGYTKDEAAVKKLHELIIPARFHKEHLKGMMKFQETGKGNVIGTRIELAATRKDGTEFPVDFSLSGMRYEDRWVAVGMIRDITERKRAEEDIKASEKKYRTLVEHLPQKIFVKDKNLAYVSCNDNYARDLGIQSGEITGRTDYEFYPRELAEKYRAEDKRIMESGEAEELEEKYIQDEREFFVHTAKTPIKDEKGNTVGILGIFSDITERKQAEDKLERGMERLQKAFEGTIQALEQTVEMRDPYTAGHQRRVADLARAMAKEMGLPAERIEGLHMAGVIHDVGKIAVPAEILTRPGRITEAEFSIIKTHTQVGYDILKGIDFPWPVADIVLQHQERMDGSGYPGGLSGGEILLEARILAVADTVEAMAAHRPYRPALGIDKALEEISQKRGVLYDPDAVDACVRLFREKGFKLE